MSSEWGLLQAADTPDETANGLGSHTLVQFMKSSSGRCISVIPVSGTEE